MDPRIAQSMDAGESFLDKYGDTPAAQSYLSVASAVVGKCESAQGDDKASMQ